jgi:hypothetical protein
MSRTRRFWYNKEVVQRKGLYLSTLRNDYDSDKKRISLLHKDWYQRNVWRRKIRRMNKLNIKRGIYEYVVEYKNVYFD